MAPERGARSERFAAYEAAFDRFYSANKALDLCEYHRKKLAAAVLDHADRWFQWLSRLITEEALLRTLSATARNRTAPVRPR